MVYHGMNIIKSATNYLNKGQTPVMVCDLPLYVLAKKIQWKYKETHGEDKFVLVLGGLHIEKLIYEVIDDYFEGSGWSIAISNGRVASSGESETYTGGHSITCLRYFFQVTALALLYIG